MEKKYIITKQIKFFKCLKCGFEWRPLNMNDLIKNKKVPKVCKRCKNPNWRKEKTIPKYLK